MRMSLITKSLLVTTETILCPNLMQLKACDGCLLKFRRTYITITGL